MVIIKGISLYTSYIINSVICYIIGKRPVWSIRHIEVYPIQTTSIESHAITCNVMVSPNTVPNSIKVFPQDGNRREIRHIYSCNQLPIISIKVARFYSIPISVSPIYTPICKRQLHVVPRSNILYQQIIYFIDNPSIMRQ